MTEDVSVVIHGVKADGTECVSAAETWSIQKGAIARLNDWYGDGNADHQLRCVLMANMLNYGAAAQVRFDHNLDKLATAGLAQEYLDLITDGTPDMQEIEEVDDTGMAATLQSLDLNLGDKVELLPVFRMSSNVVKEEYHAEIVQTHKKADGTETVTTYTIEGKDCLASGKYLGVYLNNLKSSEMRDVLTVTLYKGDVAVSATHTLSVESVCAAKLSTYPELIPALMNYADASKAVFG